MLCQGACNPITQWQVYLDILPRAHLKGVQLLFKRTAGSPISTRCCSKSQWPILDTSSCLVLEQGGGTERERHTITFQISRDETESTLTSVISPGPKHSMFNKSETTRLQVIHGLWARVGGARTGSEWCHNSLLPVLYSSASCNINTKRIILRIQGSKRVLGFRKACYWAAYTLWKPFLGWSLPKRGLGYFHTKKMLSITTSKKIQQSCTFVRAWHNI